MTELVATTMGLFPLPDWAKRELEDLKGHQKHDLIDGTEDEDIQAVYDQARNELLKIQSNANIDIPVEGQLRWDDMLVHPLAVNDAVETRGIVRYYDNNNFYREPVITDELTSTGDMAADLETALETVDSIGAVVPGPYTLADLATDEYYGDQASLVTAVAEYLATEIEAFPDVETLLLASPSLATHPPAAEVPLQEALTAVATAADATTILYPYWGALDTDTYGTVRETAVDVVGFDLVSAWEQHCENIAEHGVSEQIAAGVVDGQNTRVESPTEIRETIEQFTADTGYDPARTYMLPNTGTFYLPTNRFAEKLDALSTAGVRPEVTQ